MMDTEPKQLAKDNNWDKLHASLYLCSKLESEAYNTYRDIEVLQIKLNRKVSLENRRKDTIYMKYTNESWFLYFICLYYQIDS